MSAQPTEEPYEVIHIGEHAAAVVPLDDLQRLRAITRHASPQALEAAALEEAAEIRRQSDAWIAAGRPGAVSHEEFRRDLRLPPGQRVRRYRAHRLRRVLDQLIPALRHLRCQGPQE